MDRTGLQPLDLGWEKEEIKSYPGSGEVTDEPQGGVSSAALSTQVWAGY